VELIGTSGDVETSRAPFSGRKTELVLAETRRSTGRLTASVFLTTGDPADVVLVKLDPARTTGTSGSRARPTSARTRARWSQRGIRSEDRVDVEAERDQRGFFRIRPRAPLAPGEFAFVFTRTSGTMPGGALYDFGVD